MDSLLNNLLFSDHNLSTAAFNLSNIDLTTEAGLSSFLSGSNIDFGAATSIELLSAFNSQIQDLSQTLLQGLSADPIHPYDLIKLSLFGSDYKFPTIDEIEVPEEVTPQSIVDNLKGHEKQYRQNLLEYVHNREDYQLTGFHDHITMLSEPSGEKCFTVTEKRFKNYIEAVEILVNINREDINELNYMDYYKKIGYCLTKILTQKTV
jgi:hypothetical protein